MGKTTKVMRYEVIKPLDCSWKELGDILFNIQGETRNALNKTIQYCWEWAGFSADYKAKNNEYPNPKNIIGLSGVSSLAYQKLSALYTKPNTGNLSMSIRKACQRWNTDLKEILRGDKTVPNFRKDCPIDLHNKNISIFYNMQDGRYFVNLSLLSNSYKAEIGRESGQFSLAINSGKSSSKVILNRCISGEYKISASQLLHRNHKWLFNLSYTFENGVCALDENRILGIDLGIVHPFYMVVSDTGRREWIEGGEIEQFRKQVDARKKSLQRQGRHCGGGRIGHGTKTRVKPVSDIKDKIARFRDTVNHKYSKYIIEFAKRNGCGTIQMEDLTGISDNYKDKKFLKDWPYYDLQTKIKYKGKEAGMNVVFRNAQYTTQRCFKCGYIHEDNVPVAEKYRIFRCMKCKYETDADHNAAQNLSLPDIENLIQKTLECEM
jgi:IS605 OrfB family transposase